MHNLDLYLQKYYELASSHTIRLVRENPEMKEYFFNPR